MEREIFFEDEEYSARQERVGTALVASGVDLYVTTNPSCIAWLCGHFSVNVWDLMFLLLAPGREPTLCLWQFEELRFQASAVRARSAAWNTCDDPVAFAADIARRDHPGARIAIDVASPAAPYATLERLRIALDARIIGGLIDDVRLVKSAAEIDIMRRSAEISDAAIEAGFAVCAPGVADSTIAATTMATLAERGSAMFSVAPIVAIGWRSGVPHSSWGGSILGAADPAFIELGAAVGRYTVPLMRTRCFEPTAQILRLAHFSDSCIEACMERTSPGVRICDIVQAGLDALKPIRGDILFHDTLGYSLGVTYPPAWLDHPGFILTLANTARIEEDMVFHFPVMLRVAGQYGAGFSESVRVTATGCERFSRLPRSLAFV